MVTIRALVYSISIVLSSSVFCNGQEAFFSYDGATEELVLIDTNLVITPVIQIQFPSAVGPVPVTAGLAQPTDGSLVGTFLHTGPTCWKMYLIDLSTGAASVIQDFGPIVSEGITLDGAEIIYSRATTSGVSGSLLLFRLVNIGPSLWGPPVLICNTGFDIDDLFTTETGAIRLKDTEPTGSGFLQINSINLANCQQQPLVVSNGPVHRTPVVLPNGEAYSLQGVGSDVFLVSFDQGTGAITTSFGQVPSSLSGLVPTSAVIEAPFVRFDSNSDAAIDISDPIFTLGYLFLGSPTPTCLDAADADHDGSIALLDIFFSLSYLFQQGPQPEPPFSTCGVDFLDSLGCDSFLCP